MRASAKSALFYLALALLATWPLALHFGSHAPGRAFWEGSPLYFETPVNLWNLWWFRHALVDLGQSPFFCPLLFYPNGANLWLHTLAPLHGLVGIVLQTFLSLAAAQNVIVLANLALAGACAAALARRFGLGTQGALLAGAVYAFSPAVFAHLQVGHFELLALVWLPAALLCFLRLIERPRLRDGVGLGLVLACAAYSSPYYALYALELLALSALVCARRLARAELVLPLAVSAGVAIAALAPLLLGYFGAAVQSASPVPAHDFDWFSGDLAGTFVPAFTHPLLAAPLRELHLRLAGGGLRLPQEKVVFLGTTVLALAAFGCWRRRGASPSLALPAAVLLVFWILSLGAQLKILGYETGVPLPAAALSHLSVFEQARAPGRHIVLAMLGLGILAGAGLECVRSRAVRALLALAVAFEFAAAPLPLFEAAAAPVYQRLAREPGEFAVLELPLEVRDGTHLRGLRNEEQMLGQTVHGHALLGGMVSRLPAATLEAILAEPVVGTLLHPRGATKEALERDLREGPAWFERFRVRAIVVHAPLVGGPQQLYLERVLPISGRELFPDGSQLLWISSRSASK